MIGSKNSCHLLDQSDATELKRPKTNHVHDLVTRVFLRLLPVTWYYFEFSLAPWNISLCSDWPLWFLWFWFHEIQSKSDIREAALGFACNSSLLPKFSVSSAIISIKIKLKKTGTRLCSTYLKTMIAGCLFCLKIRNGFIATDLVSETSRH